MEAFRTDLLNLGTGVDVKAYSAHAFRRGGIQFLDWQGASIQAICKWAGWACNSKFDIVLRYLFNEYDERETYEQIHRFENLPHGKLHTLLM